MLAKLKSWQVFLLLLIAVFSAYWGSWNAFFQQDEWAGLGGFFSLKRLGLADLVREMYLPMFSQGLGHFLPWTPAVNYIRYALFGLNYPPYAILGLVLHALATILVFLLGRKLTKSNTAGFLAALFFAVAASASQAVTWAGTSLPTQLAAILSLVSIIFWLDWLNKEKRKDLLLALGALVLAVGFKETALFLFVFLPVLGYLVKPSLRTKLAVWFGLAVAGYVVLRLAILVWAVGVSGAPGELARVFQPLVRRTGKVILTGISQTVFPQEFILRSSEEGLKYVRVIDVPQKGTTAYDLFLENRVVKTTTRAASILIFLGILALLRTQNKKERFPVLAALLLFITSFLPLALIPTGELTSAFLAPRGYYIPLMGFSVIFGTLTVALVKKRAFLAILPLLLVGLHAFTLRSQVHALINQGQMRETILQDIESAHPDLPETVVFYTESDAPYYGLPPEEYIMPFQSGFGQTLLVWYYPQEVWPQEFLQDRFLWEITEQGYKEAGGRGFGYFREFDLLKEGVEQYNIPTNSVVAFSWEGEDGRLTDVTEETRRKLDETL